MERRFDLIVYGASGFTGRLVADHLQRRCAGTAGWRWALAGRDADRLAAVRDAIGAPADLPLITADAADAEAIETLVRSTRLVLTTVGPYLVHGQTLVTACANAGTDYVDLCGEPAWMARMIRRLQPGAARSGARIVLSCGFDSIPFDLGVVFLQDAAQRRFGRPLSRVRGRVRQLKGGPSGGTVASLLATVEQMRRDPDAARTMADAFALTPGFSGPAQPDDPSASYDPSARSWTGPFVMAPINTKNVHRTNALRGHPWGRDFVYDERLLTGDGVKGEALAHGLALQSRVQAVLLDLAPTRALLRRFALRRPGEGPDARAREAGRYEIAFSGETARGERLDATVTGDRDPGYGSTSRMIGESALCLLNDVDAAMTGGGVWTPGAAMGLALVRRLQSDAGLRFTIDDPGP